MAEKNGGEGQRRSFSRGTVIFREGDIGNEAYLLHQGTVRIFKTVAGRRVTIGMVRPFQVFGELSMMDESPRMAGAIADDDIVCLILPKQAIRAMMDQAPEGLATLIQSMLATMRSMGRELADARATLAERDGDG
ncbi:Crp/Fnr family transcriptional regulator [Magnetospirillum fulvum]|uniref:Cyclic nucleotide-binding domain-containing protein n=1 Tax=Magnetospirillum fulvum TaxID=1082 RepID=A0A1H6HGU1_MAGFU|nr:cyclic nucleotide-binding domain-containing protein [Magnetospirillum fulvum]SEH33475.1 Cyclic nucleotide-binding domain-containing protein [Magnetospirillum fulvum]